MLRRSIFILLLLMMGHAQAIDHVNEGNIKAAVVTAHPLASQVGKEIIAAGGNAFDAAVAVSLALAVVEPYGSGLGGGGFWLLHSAVGEQDVMIDGREVAPLAAHPNLYRNADGSISRDSVNCPRAAGIPGMLAALELISQRYGRLPWQQLVLPAVVLAKRWVCASCALPQISEDASTVSESSCCSYFLIKGDAGWRQDHAT